MGINRRNFIKLAGITAAVGVGGKKIMGELVDDTTGLPVVDTAQKASPLKAKRWAMVIDLKKCREKQGCTACINACHAVHNVPDLGNPKDEVKWIWKEDFEGAFPSADHKYLEEEIRNSHALVFCNHCDNPPCVRVCPTQATWRRKADGIVMMDMHRCIGCRYCVVACPYGSRSFNWRDPKPFIKEINPDYPTRMRGVVEKCNFCEERLDRGKMPACVEACPEKALVFGDLEDADSEVRKLLREHYTIRRKPSLGTNPEIYYIV